MKLFKSLLCAGTVILVGMPVFAASPLTASNPVIQLPNCQGTAQLRYNGETPYLYVQASQCSFILNDGGQREKISPSGYPLAPNHTYVMTVTSERGDRTGHVDQFEVNTARYEPSPRPRPYPGPEHRPYPGHVPSVDLYGSGSEVALPSCNGMASFHQTFFTETPRLNFKGVTECTYYTVLSAENEAMVLDATQSRLIKDSYGWSGQFDLPNRWGTNKVRVRLQSATNEHAVDIFVHFMTR